MKKKITDLHERAEQYRAEAQAACEDNNNDAETDAILEFENGETAKFFNDWASFITGLAVTRLELVKSGEYFFPFRSRDGEYLAKLLSMCTEADYDAWGYNDGMSDEEVIAASESDTLICRDCMSSAATSATKMQEKLVCVMIEYARTAAALAKQIGSSSVLDWAGILDILELQRIGYSFRVNEEQAFRMVELEKAAANRLRLDMIIAALPPFKKARSPKKGR